MKTVFAVAVAFALVTISPAFAQGGGAGAFSGGGAVGGGGTANGISGGTGTGKDAPHVASAAGNDNRAEMGGASGKHHTIKTLKQRKKERTAASSPTP